MYDHVIKRERRGDYLGKTVQIVPHVTNAIQDWIQRVSAIPTDGDKEADICLIELGGTVGDIERYLPITPIVYMYVVAPIQPEQQHTSKC